MTWRKTDDGRPVKAACYVRMSTEHQRYSTENQIGVIQTFAKQHNLDIVKTYQDAGKSGLTIERRSGLKALVGDVSSGKAEFVVVLVYDISRWGRFQDVGESTYYEFLCRRQGVDVCYCAEQFENDGSIGSEIQKVVKQSMAAEYSRELSVKVFLGQANLIRKGFRQGGHAGFGLRRTLLDETGAFKQELRYGERKSLQTDRVILRPGPDDEVERVRWIFSSFISGKMLESDIASNLNSLGIRTDLGRHWTRGTVHQILVNPKYVGDNVWNRRSSKLGGRSEQNPREAWIEEPDAFTAIVTRDQFELVQRIIEKRHRRLSDNEMLAVLRDILLRRGQLSGLIIDEEENAPSSSCYARRFGSLHTSYQLIGYDTGRDLAYLADNRRLREMHPSVVSSAIGQIVRSGGTVQQMRAGLLSVNSELAISLVLCRHNTLPSGASRWTVRFDTVLCPDLTVAVRMDKSNTEARDYFVLPFVEMTTEHLKLKEANGAGLDAYRFESLDFLGRVSSRTPLREVS
ncbi:recombinase family protein [Aureimonas frigidaquae]|uniref:recombinase family protein n=1 Tax=Aureimonas frigidaquae TaxID=424757 RepID=UPI00192CE943|nr:recombinase family protein [Aureimonas frigidaquae]